MAGKLPNWSGFPPYLLLFSPVLGSRNSVIVLNCHAYFPFSGFNGVSSALMINNKNSWLNSERASKSVWSCLILFRTALPRWLESFQIDLVSPRICYLFSQFSQAGTVSKKFMNMTKGSRRDDAQCATTHTTVCTSYVAAVVPSYILLGCLARVAGKLWNWSSFLLVSPVLASRNSVKKVMSMTKESSRGDAQCATTNTTVCTVVPRPTLSLCSQKT